MAHGSPRRLSRSKIELFLSCPRCFYLDRICGVARPDFPPYTLNNAVDALLKKEFDVYRARGEPHPLMKTYGIDAIPFDHPELSEWRENFRGVQSLHEATNFLVCGAIDEVWINPKGELIVVDFKSTSTARDITLDGKWKGQYKRQIEVYQWLLRRKGFTVSRTGYFIFVNAEKDREAFDRKLEFSVRVLPYDGDDSWVEEALEEAALCLKRASAPLAHPECEWCKYREAATKADLHALTPSSH
jgi:RecB family exonuclease